MPRVCPEVNWERLVAERNEWVAKNFPDAEPLETVLGMIEEVGELAHADLKERQNIRGTVEEHQAAAKDAIGDFTIYLLGVLSRTGLEILSPTYYRHVNEKWAQSTFLLQGRMARCTGVIMTEFDQFLAGKRVTSFLKSNVTSVILYAEAYCKLRGWDYAEIVHSTWQQVSKRDWIADPQAGGESPTSGQTGGTTGGGATDPELHGSDPSVFFFPDYP